MNNYDDYKTGLHDSDSPMNRETFSQEQPTWNNLSDAYDSGFEHVFHDKRIEIIEDLGILYEVLKATDNGLKGRVLKIIEKMM